MEFYAVFMYSSDWTVLCLCMHVNCLAQPGHVSSPDKASAPHVVPVGREVLPRAVRLRCPDNQGG